MIIYTSAYDAIMNHRVEAIVTETYAPNLPDAYMDGEVDPIFSPCENDEAYAMLTPQEVVNMICDGTKFRLTHTEDLKIIYDYLAAYVDSLVNTGNDLSAITHVGTKVFLARLQQALPILRQRIGIVEESQGVKRTLSIFDLYNKE